MDVALLMVIFIIILIAIIVFTNLRGDRRTINSLRNNNNESRDINRETSSIIGKLETENREAGKLNESIKSDNRKARDIIAEIRKQKLDW